MNDHVNGWPFIALYLKRRRVHQTDLARVLGVTPAAISQGKSGRSLFNPKQLAAIADFLAFDEAARRLFYEELFAARMRGLPHGWQGAGSAITGRIPCCPLPLLADYAPAAESLREFVSSHRSETVAADDFAPGCVAARAGVGDGAGVPAGTLLAISEKPDFPGDRCMVLGCDGGGLFAARINRDRERGIISFLPLSGLKRSLAPWNFRREPGKIRFLLPLLSLKPAQP